MRFIDDRMPRGVEVNTVDSYQGREKDVIVFSTAATRNLGFAEDPNRLNVAFTRAKKKLIVLANRATIENTGDLLKKYLSYVEEKGCTYNYNKDKKNIEPNRCRGTQG